MAGLRRPGDGQPCGSIIAMQDQGRRFFHFAIHKEHDHLAVALVRAMVRAFAIMHECPRCMQVEGLNTAQPGPEQLLIYPGQRLVAGSANNKKGRYVHKSL